MTTYIRTHGRQLRWTVATLKDAGIDVQRVDRGLGSDYYIVADAPEASVDAALQYMAGYKRRPKRKPTALRIMDGLLLLGVVAAGMVALVAPLGGVVVLAWLGVTRVVGGILHEHATTMYTAGGRYRLYAVIGMALVLALIAGFVIVAGGLAGAQIAAGNSALKLLQVQP